jgi:hypothetical protein
LRLERRAAGIEAFEDKVDGALIVRRLLLPDDRGVQDRII